MSDLTLAFLGPLLITQNDSPLTGFRSHKERMLLAYLAEEAGKPHERSSLISLFWPEMPERAARNNLSQTLGRLRRTLRIEASQPDSGDADRLDSGDDAGYIDATRRQLQFMISKHRHIDTLRFCASLDGFRHAPKSNTVEALKLEASNLEAALQLYRGEFLQDLSLPECEEFEQWLLVKRAYYQRLAVDGLERLGRLYHDDGRYADAQAAARRHLTLEPWAESAHRQLMSALIRNGERSAALAQYKQCRRVLWKELGVEPEISTIQLYEQIKRGASAHVLLNSAPVQSDLSMAALRPMSAASRANGQRLLPASAASLQFEDWGEMPVHDFVFGREREVAQLHDWIALQGVRFVAILGMGGQGKTALAATYVRTLCVQRRPPFTQIIWRTLLNAPPLDELLQSWLDFLLDGSAIAIPRSAAPQSLDEKLGLLFRILRNRRILLILDNVESILAADKRPGGYRSGYEAYAQLFRRMGESTHQSCLLITSRERPSQMARMARQSPLIRTLPLEGLAHDAAFKLLTALNLGRRSGGWQTLVARYSGNPLALLLVAETIEALFGGDAAAFLAGGNLFFDDVRHVLDEQFARLTELERALLIWLAVERTGTTAVDLRKDLWQADGRQGYVEALRSLERRSLLMRRQGVEQLTVHNLIGEYAIELLRNA